MGIYINDIEMPKNHNHITITIWPNGAASYGLYDRGDSLLDYRNVEAVSVPQHGDLIDRDKTRKIIKPWSLEDERNGCTFDTAKKLMHTMLDRAPVVIPADARGEINMKVRDAIDFFVYGQAFYIKGAYSGKIYYKSYENKHELLEKYLDEEVPSVPFFTDLYTPKHQYGQAYTYPIIGIWMKDYYICNPEKFDRIGESTKITEPPKEET